MKLQKFPTGLPIEAISDVTRILGILIVTVKNKNFFLGSDNFSEYDETVQDLRKDLNDCFELYETWQHEDNAEDFKDALDRMHEYLTEAKSTLDRAMHKVH